MKYVFISILVFFTLSAFAQKEDSLVLNKNVFIQKSDVIPILDNNQEKVGELKYDVKSLSLVKAICTFKDGNKIVISNPYSSFIYSKGILFNYGDSYFGCVAGHFNIRSINTKTKETFEYTTGHMYPDITVDDCGNLYATTIHNNGKGYHFIKYDGKNKKIAFEKALFNTEEEFAIANIRMKGMEFFDDELYISYNTETPGTYFEKWSITGERIYKKKIDTYYTSFIILDKDILIGTYSERYTTMYNVNTNKMLTGLSHPNSYHINSFILNKSAYVVAKNESSNSFVIYTFSKEYENIEYNFPFNEKVGQINKNHISYINKDEKGNDNINIIEN